MLLAQEELKNTYLSQRDAAGNTDWGQANQTLQALLIESGFHSRPSQLLHSGYGLPQDSEWQELQAQSETHQRQLHLLNVQLEEQIRLLLTPERLAEMENGKANLKQLNTHLREQHKASGGIVL